MTDEEIVKAVIEYSRFVNKQEGCPRDVWHPKYGWILKDGKPTPTTEEFLKKIEEK